MLVGAHVGEIRWNDVLAGGWFTASERIGAGDTEGRSMRRRGGKTRNVLSSRPSWG